jgi:hypothetical protein
MVGAGSLEKADPFIARRKPPGRGAYRTAIATRTDQSRLNAAVLRSSKLERAVTRFL